MWRRLVALNGVETELFPEYSKMRSRELGDAAGVAGPVLLDGPVASQDLALDAYGDEFVIKPNWGTSSRGVLVLRRVDADRYLDLVDRESLDGDAVRAKVVRLVSGAGRGSAADLIVEKSMAVGTVRPQEWKIFVFGEQIGLIEQVDRNAGVMQVRNFRRDWTPTGRIRSDRTEAEGLPPPLDRDRLTEAALRVGALIPSGFVRVDLYENTTTGEAVLGEVCLIPGGDLYFRKGLDRELGVLWNDADARLLAARQTLVP